MAKYSGNSTPVQCQPDVHNDTCTWSDRGLTCLGWRSRVANQARKLGVPEFTNLTPVGCAVRDTNTRKINIDRREICNMEFVDELRSCGRSYGLRCHRYLQVNGLSQMCCLYPDCSVGGRNCMGSTGETYRRHEDQPQPAPPRGSVSGGFQRGFRQSSMELQGNFVS